MIGAVLVFGLHQSEATLIGAPHQGALATSPEHLRTSWTGGLLRRDWRVGTPRWTSTRTPSCPAPNLSGLHVCPIGPSSEWLKLQGDAGAVTSASERAAASSGRPSSRNRSETASRVRATTDLSSSDPDRWDLTGTPSPEFWRQPGACPRALEGAGQSNGWLLAVAPRCGLDPGRHQSSALGAACVCPVKPCEE